MITHSFGDVTVTRVEEMLGPGFEPGQLFPDYDPESFARHLHWMAPNYFDQATGKFISSIHSWLIRTERHTILVDCCAGSQKERPSWPRFHRTQSPLLDRLREAGVAPESVDIVLCTHLHVDHVGWNTRLQDGRWVPTFPNAKYLFSKIEHDFWDPGSNPNSRSADEQAIYQDSVLPVVASEQAWLLDGAHAIEDGLLVEPAPGHTPGHMILSIAAHQERAILSGDVMHQPIQVYEPGWNSRFCEDAVLARATRRKLLERCCESGALLMPAHFGRPHAGWIRDTGSGFAIDFAG